MALEQTRHSAPRAKGLVSPPTGLHIRSSRTEPPSDLADIVETFWTAGWSLPVGVVHEVQLLADPCLHLVMEGAQSKVVGIYTALWSRPLVGTGVVYSAKLRPGATQALFDEPASSFSNKSLPWTDFWPCPPPTAQFDALAAHIRAHRRPANRAAIDAVDAIKNDPSLQSVEMLARSLGTTPRSLQRLFKAHVGASPKWVLRRFRLQEAAQRVELGKAPCLSNLAFELGYADQAHLARDFKAAVGESLRTFEARVRREPTR